MRRAYDPFRRISEHDFDAMATELSQRVPERSDAQTLTPATEVRPARQGRSSLITRFFQQGRLKEPRDHGVFPAALTLAPRVWLRPGPTGPVRAVMP